ncbi:hypothetical protein KP509_11G093800 [Ceratopteris richardii]|nr:hypothetical protein KP509_11G093800 [Ceratopteris richardii]KAH7426286.1 hypothetical protein KP509_11G093800 [Ceratopteris richardii]
MSLPTPFRSVKRNGSSKEPHGVNFATSGSTILTSSSMPSVSSQIDAFQSNIMSKYTPQQLASAIVLYCTSGDDYFFYLATSSSSLSSIYPLTVNVGKQISMDLVKLYGLGLRKFFVAYLPPSGCLPVASSANRYKGCNDTWTRSIAVPHNERIFKNVLGLRHYFKNGTILLIDLFSAFSAAQSEIGTGGLQPCCMGTIVGMRCGSVSRARALYSLCPSPNTQFYWDDSIHPTDAGWKLVGNQLQSSLNAIKK